jgi:hypothetical protein
MMQMLSNPAVIQQAMQMMQSGQMPAGMGGFGMPFGNMGGSQMPDYSSLMGSMNTPVST